MVRVIDTLQGRVFGGTIRADELNGGNGNDTLNGLAGNDGLYGGRGDDLLDGGDGNDDLEGGLGNDRLFGGAGRDTLEGGRGDDILTGGAGADVFEFLRGDGRDVITDFTNGQDRLEIAGLNLAAIQSLIASAGQVGNDVVLTLGPDSIITLQNFRLADLDLSDFEIASSAPNSPSLPPLFPQPVLPPVAPVLGRDIDGTRGNDRLTGTAGNDDIDGFGGDDQLRGGAGNDDIDGGDGSDQLWGDDGRDDIDGGRGNDRLDGGAGSDVLDGGRGNDILTGGAGADVFEFRRGDGRDRITDFANGVDRIELDGFTVAQLNGILAGARQVGADVVLDLPASSAITIANMQLSQLDRSDFIL